jgi:hypothetical protein
MVMGFTAFDRDEMGEVLGNSYKKKARDENDVLRLGAFKHSPIVRGRNQKIFSF